MGTASSVNPGRIRTRTLVVARASEPEISRYSADTQPSKPPVTRTRTHSPSVESRFHAGILRERPGVDAVLHFQSPCATVLACCELAGVDFAVIPEIPYYIGPVAIVPYLPPGSPELAEAVVEAMTRHGLAVLQNHGQVVAGKTLDDAIQKAAFFELACEVVLRGGEGVRPLPREAVAHLGAAAKGHRPEAGPDEPRAP